MERTKKVADLSALLEAAERDDGHEVPLNGGHPPFYNPYRPSSLKRPREASHALDEEDQDVFELLYSIKYPHGPPPLNYAHGGDAVDGVGGPASGSNSRDRSRSTSATRVDGDGRDEQVVKVEDDDIAGESDDGEDAGEAQSPSDEVASASPGADAEPEDKRGWNKRRKIRGQKGIDVSLEAGKLVFDKCTKVDGKYRQPKMVIMEDITKTKTYQAIQARSAASLVKVGSSERYKDRTQSLLDLLDDEGIIWGKVLPAGKHPGGGPCGSCRHYSMECIVPLRKVKPEKPGDAGYRILSICIHCKLYHTCDLNATVDYKPSSKAIKIVKTGRGKSRGIRAALEDEEADMQMVDTPTKSKNGANEAASLSKGGNLITAKKSVPPPKVASRPARVSKPPTRTASAPARQGPPPMRVSARIKERGYNHRFSADLDPSDVEDDMVEKLQTGDDGEEGDIEMGHGDSDLASDAVPPTGGPSPKVKQEEREGSGTARGIASRVQSVRDFVAEMRKREQSKGSGKLDYVTKVMFERVEQDIEEIHTACS